MSILKGILHHWNKTTSAYDTIHPETEAAQVMDWNQGIVNTLASTALGGLVSTLTSDSLFATLLKKALTALGVKYLAAQNGYICFGEIVGNITIQWGKESSSDTSGTITLPIAPGNIFALTIFDNGQLNDSLDTSMIKGHWTSDYSGITWYAFIPETGNLRAPATFNWICICLAS